MEENYINPNIFQSDSDFSVVDIGSDQAIQVRCPHCQSIGTFTPGVTKSLRYQKDAMHESVEYSWPCEAVIRTCPNKECNGVVFSITSYNKDGHQHITFPSQKLNFNPENIPENLTRTLKEAISCHSQGAYRACAMMVRRLLEELCLASNAEGRTLHDRLKNLRSQITLSEELFDAMDELKSLGNDAAHIEAKAFAAVDKEEAELSIELAQEILKARYQHKSLVERLRARKKSSLPS